MRGTIFRYIQMENAAAQYLLIDSDRHRRLCSAIIRDAEAASAAQRTRDSMPVVTPKRFAYKMHTYMCIHYTSCKRLNYYTCVNDFDDPSFVRADNVLILYYTVR